MNFQISPQYWTSVFAVPSEIIDKYLKISPENALKVFLYILRKNGSPISIEDICEALSLKSEQVEEAILFWKEKSVIADELKPSISTATQSENISETANKEETAKPDTGKKEKIKNTSYGSYTPSELAKRINESENIRFLFNTSENLFCRNLTNTEHRSLIWMHEYLGLNIEVILMLIDYCASIDKLYVAYIDKIAYSWRDLGINSIELAEEEIKAMKEHSSYIGKIRSMFRMQTFPTSKQTEIINSWKEKNYNMELISYAYEKTLNAINKLSFPYIDKILNDWYSKGLVTLEKIQENDNQRAKSFNTNNSIDMDMYDSLALIGN